MRIKTIIVICTGSFLLFTSCSKQRLIGKVICEGHIYNINDDGVEGIKVTLQACNPHDGRNFCARFDLGSATTDASGYYKITEKAARSDRYYINGNGIKFQELHMSQLKDYNYTDGHIK